MEELRRQMAESMPGTMDVFAEAYAKLTNSGLSGQKAIEALDAAVGDGKVISAEILPIVSEILKQRAAPKLDVMKKTSIAEQARAENRWADLVFSFGESGGEKGFARIWRSLAIALKEATPFAEKLGKAFNEMSKYASFLILLPQSIQRAFQGRDSWFADLIGKDNVERLRRLGDSLKNVMEGVGGVLETVIKGWKLLLDQFGDDFLTAFTGFVDRIGYVLKGFNAAVNGDFTAAGRYMDAARASMAGATPEEIARILEGQKPGTLGGKTASDFNKEWKESGKELEAAKQYQPEGFADRLFNWEDIGYKWVKHNMADSFFSDENILYRERQRAARLLYDDPNSQFYQDWKGAWKHAQSLDVLGKNPQSSTSGSQNNYEININVDPATLNNMDTAKQAEYLASAFQIALQQMPA